jgi:hypothetical protein
MIYTFGGQMLLLGIWGLLGLIGTTALTLLVMVRKGLPLTTQTNRQTGVREHGVFRWWVTISLFCLLPQVLLAVAATGVHVVRWAAGWVWAHWWVLLIAAAVAALAWGARWLWRPERAQESRWGPIPTAVPVVAQVPVQTPPAPPVELWAMPEVEGNWARRD